VVGFICHIAAVSHRNAVFIILAKRIGDDTKAAARHSPNCIRKKLTKYGEKKRFSIWRMEFLHPAM